MDIATEQEPFRLTSERRGEALLLHVAGEIDIATVPGLDLWLDAAVGDGVPSVVVDLEQVTFMDVGGLRAFIRASRRANRAGGTFAISRASGIVRRVFELTGTTHLLAADTLASAPLVASGAGLPSGL